MLCAEIKKAGPLRAGGSSFVICLQCLLKFPGEISSKALASSHSSVSFSVSEACVLTLPTSVPQSFGKKPTFLCVCDLAAP